MESDQVFRGKAPKSGHAGIWFDNRNGNQYVWRATYKGKTYGRFETVEEAVEFREKVINAIENGLPVPKGPYRRNARSGEFGVSYKLSHGKEVSRPWWVIYKGVSYGGFPTKEEGVAFRNKVAEAIRNGEPAPKNPYFGLRSRRVGKSGESGKGIQPGEPKNIASGYIGIHKYKNGNYMYYRVVYHGVRYGQYQTLEDALDRMKVVVDCVDNGKPVPPGPLVERRKKQALKKKEDEERRKAEAEARKEEKRKAREAEAEKKKLMKNRNRQSRRSKNFAINAESALAEKHLEELAVLNSVSHDFSKKKAKVPAPIPDDGRPVFSGETQRQRDNNACRQCYWSGQSTGEMPSCMYGITPGNRTRLAMHYERTGEQEPTTLTHGENCTEWAPKKGKRPIVFTAACE